LLANGVVISEAISCKADYQSALRLQFSQLRSPMSRAFVKETDGDDPFDNLPERPVSDQPNPVTPAGLKHIETTILDLQTARQQAKANPENTELARIERDLRYWLQRRASAQVIAAEPDPVKARFGVSVTLKFEDGQEKTFTLVGEDEANPALGLISWLAPVAQALLGREIGDEVELPGGRAEIIGLTSTAH
jgi:transcription elongation GreA/GreB family factor